MQIKDLQSAGAMPTLEMAVRFAGQRQRLIAHNIANISTPDFRPTDVSPKGFQELLGEAIDARRRKTGGEHGELKWRETREIRRDGTHGLKFNPRQPSGNILFHDRNNRDLERMMQDMVENAAYYRAATEFLYQQRGMIESAIAERVG